jgi:hypothetical protein
LLNYIITGAPAVKMERSVMFLVTGELPILQHQHDDSHLAFAPPHPFPFSDVDETFVWHEACLLLAVFILLR